MRFLVTAIDVYSLAPTRGRYIRRCVQRSVFRDSCSSPSSSQPLSVGVLAREKSTGRRVAIKKIKVGQFKDGLDMSAIREVKYLRELSHPNVIEVRELPTLAFRMRQTDYLRPSNLAPGRIFFKDEP